MDLLLHFSVSVGLIVGLYLIMLHITKNYGKAFEIAFATTIIAGLYKEVYDVLTDGLFSGFDLLADGIGIIVGAYICYKISLKKRGIHV